MNSYPKHEKRNIRLLDGLWDFAFLGEKVPLNEELYHQIHFTEKMIVPSAFDATPGYAGVRGTFAYRTYCKMTPGMSSRLRFHGMGMWCRVYVDGERLQECSLPYSGFWVDVPESENIVRELVVLVDNRFDYERVPLQKPYFDFYAFGGLFRSVEWHEYERFCIDRAKVESVDAGLKVTVGFHGVCPDQVDLAIKVNDNNEQEFEEVRLKENLAVLTLDFLTLDCGELASWSPESPVLHTLTVRTNHDDIIERFGLRQLDIQDGRICLNGKPQKLLGYCRHETHPQFGPALPGQLLLNDLLTLKDMGCNFVRGAHYPQDQRFLDLCDELGLMVFEESLGWQDRERDFQNPHFVAQQEEQTRLMVRNSINHPSVIMWGFLNEGYSHLECSKAVYRRLADAIREEDSSRFVTYASNRPFEDVNFDLADIISINTYPGWYGEEDNFDPVTEIVPKLQAIMAHLEEAGQSDKPFLVSEIGAGAIYGWRDAHKAHWSEEFQAEHLQTVCKEVVSNDKIAGVALWQFCDGRTYNGARALSRPRAFNNKGTLDEYRRPKLAYENVKRIFKGQE